MGREVKRVPLDFGATIGKVWSGYLGEKWTHPPEGEGYQLWETVIEGSPMSPVFSTSEGLARWMSDNPCMPGPYGGVSVTLEQARRFVAVGWAPTGAVVRGRWIDDVTSL